jgi:GNAT superfamily N-acetyltransferase
MEYRQATEKDLQQLAELRWDFRTEDDEEIPAVSRDVFLEACVTFMRQGLDRGDQAYWLAVQGEEIIANIFVQMIPMVPRPCKIDDRFGYVTNNYTRPNHRNQGIGSELMKRVTEWATEQDLELLIVWPSDRAVTFYERAGFTPETDIMQLVLREYYSPEWGAEGRSPSA